MRRNIAYAVAAVVMALVAMLPHSELTQLLLRRVS